MNGLVVYPLLVLVLTWIAYPLAIRLLGAARRRDAARAEITASPVSVVVASADDAPAIRLRVADILATRHPAHLIEVIVALDSTHARASPADLVFPDERVRVLVGDAPGGKATALNAGVRAASHDILIFTDTAQRFEPGAIPALVAALDDPRLGAVSGMLDLPGKNGSLNLAERYWRYERWLRLWEARVHSAVGVTGAIYAMRRTLWRPLPAGLILDDLYVPMQLVLEGWRIGFTDRAVASDTRRFRPEQEYRRKVRTLTGNIQVCAWLPGILNPVRNPLWVQFVCHKLLRLSTPYLLAIALLGVGIATMRAVARNPGSVPAIVLVLGVLTLLAGANAPVRRRVWAQIGWALALQGSVVLATLNGARGRWDVWTRNA